VTAKVDGYYGFVIRRLASRGELPVGFHAAVPPSPRVAAVVRDPLLEGGLAAGGSAESESPTGGSPPPDVGVGSAAGSGGLDLP